MLFKLRFENKSVFLRRKQAAESTARSLDRKKKYRTSNSHNEEDDVGCILLGCDTV
jgi:hypothetical protein